MGDARATLEQRRKPFVDEKIKLEAEVAKLRAEMKHSKDTRLSRRLLTVRNRIADVNRELCKLRGELKRLDAEEAQGALGFSHMDTEALLRNCLKFMESVDEDDLETEDLNLMTLLSARVRLYACEA